MNTQIPGYSAVYDNSGFCPSCQQQAGTYSKTPMMYPMTGSQAIPMTGQQSLPQVSIMPAASAGFAGQMSPQTSAQSEPMTLPPSAPITDLTQPAPMTMESTEYLNGFLRTQIGRRMRVEFLIGTNTFTDKSGKLLDVGANYILLQEAMTDDLLTCDFFNIKFITIFR